MSSAVALASLLELEREQDAIDIALARKTLIDFTLYTKPDYEVSWHHKLVASRLDDVVAGTIRRLIVCQPPQTGKSELISRRFPAYVLGRKPHTRIMGASYGATLASDMSTDVQKIIEEDSYRKLFPHTALARNKDLEKRTQDQFQVVGHRGYYLGTGILGGMTGKSADIGIVDDPLKNREEAESEVYRNRVWRQFVSAFMTRQFGDKGAIVIAMTRWHEDDLAGRLIRLQAENPGAEQYEVINLPAILPAIDVKHPEDPRIPGEALWPEKYPIAELERRKIAMGAYEWSALYQGQPTPPGGGMFQRTWFKKIGGLVNARLKLRRCRFWDCAGTEASGKNDPDWTVGTLVSMDGMQNVYIENVIRVRKTAGEVDALIRHTAETDPPGTLIREEQEPGSAGKSVVAAHTKLLSGYDYVGLPSSGDKTTRARPFAVQAEAGNVYIFDGEWNAQWLEELSAFPYGRHDDCIDSAAGGFNQLALAPRKTSPLVWGRR